MENNQNVPNHQPAMWCSMWLCSYQSIPKRVTSDTQLESKPGTIDFMNKTPVNDDSCAKPNSTVNLQFWREFFPSISDLEISWGLFTSGFTLFKLDEPSFIPFPAKCCSCPISRLGEWNFVLRYRFIARLLVESSIWAEQEMPGRCWPLGHHLAVFFHQYKQIDFLPPRINQCW